MQALEQVYKKFYPDLFPYALKLTSQANLAEDAIQETFLYLWQHRTNIGPIHSLQFYLFRSVRNKCLKLIQKAAKLDRLENAEQHLSLIIQPEELHLKDHNKQAKHIIQKALNELSPRQREIIYLKFYNNLDYKEIGNILDINYQSVVNHVHKAISKLRQSKTLDYFFR